MMPSKEQQYKFAEHCVANTFFEDGKTLSALQNLRENDPDILESIIATSLEGHSGNTIAFRTVLIIQRRIQMEFFHRYLGEMDTDILDEICHALAYIENGVNDSNPFRLGQVILEYYELWKAQNPQAVRHG